MKLSLDARLFLGSVYKGVFRGGVVELRSTEVKRVTICLGLERERDYRWRERGRTVAVCSK